MSLVANSDCGVFRDCLVTEIKGGSQNEFYILIGCAGDGKVYVQKANIMARPKEIEIKTYINIPIKIDFLLSINFT